MKQNFLQRTIEELKIDRQNVWATITAQLEDEVPAIGVNVSTEIVSLIAERAAIRVLEGLGALLERYSEIPTLRRVDAAKKLHVTTKTLLEWEKKGILKPVKICGQPYYRESDIKALNDRKEV